MPNHQKKGKKRRNKSGGGSSSSSPKAKKAKFSAPKLSGESVVGAVERKHGDTLRYMAGFGSHFSSEALPNALPKGQNTPQRCPYGLIAEQLSGTSFTTPRVKNRFTWMYRIQPTVRHKPFKPLSGCKLLISDFSSAHATPAQIRWKPFPLPEVGAGKETKDFLDGLVTMGGSGSVDTKHGFGIHMYSCNTSMGDRCLNNSDGDFLFVPQQGMLSFRTEFGLMTAAPGEIAVIQRGMKFSVDVDEPCRGYVCEIFDGHFVIPDLGPIGANGLANPRDFLTPVAWYEERNCKFTMVQKFSGQLFEAEMDHSPYDVVGWHGNYVPYKYDLANFVVVNSVSVDHLDPSIFTVLTCPTAEPGVAALDFVIFPPRWLVQDRTFRPPYYHRNCMSEFMGNIRGQYDAKPEGFAPGSASLHSCMSGHGPDADAFKAASSAALEPVYMKEALAFMFESTYIIRLTDWAMKKAHQDTNYWKCWWGLQPTFDPTSAAEPSEEQDAIANGDMDEAED